MNLLIPQSQDWHRTKRRARGALVIERQHQTWLQVPLGAKRGIGPHGSNEMHQVAAGNNIVACHPAFIQTAHQSELPLMLCGAQRMEVEWLVRMIEHGPRATRLGSTTSL